MVVCVGDFETTVYDGQQETEVWASAIVPLFTEDVYICNSIDLTFAHLDNIQDDIMIYYHNLKFDGNFWVWYLLHDLKYQQAINYKSDNEYDISFLSDDEMPPCTFRYVISDMGQWYMIKIKTKTGKIIEIRDSLKLLPFSVEKISKSFNTKHKKLSIEYEGKRYKGWNITDEERKYIANDVFVIKEALEFMFLEGHNKLTIGTCCLSEFKELFDWKDFKSYFPDVYAYKLNEKIYGYKNAGEYIRKAYKGGWCYLVRGKEKQVKVNGVTLDVNSLYPSMMSDESGNKYPVGKPHFWSGNYIPDVALCNDKYYFIRIKTRFYLKKDKLPCIQIKNDLRYPGTEWLETSDLYDTKNGGYCKKYKNLKGEIKQATVVLTLTMSDYNLIKEHYYLIDCTILDGCWFHTMDCIFDRYINKYRKIKEESTGAVRELAKLFLNHLYGKLASSTNSSFKYAYLKEDESIGFVDVREYNKKPVYIPIGAAITSYARCFTIRAAQLNYYGKDKRGFIYADTDSIHCDLKIDEIKGVTIHNKHFCCWKLEKEWEKGYFVRQKTYIEYNKDEGYDIKCAGMPERCKELFKFTLEPNKAEDWKEKNNKIYETLDEHEKNFLKKHFTINDFKEGLLIPGKLIPKRIKGGIVLQKTTYELR